MYQKISKWSSACLVFTAFSLATCGNTTSKTTPEPLDPEESKESRDVDIIDITSIMDNCNETFRTDMSYINSLNKSGSFPDETDRTAKCFVRCLLEKSRVVSEAGVFDRERAPALFAAAATAERATATDDDFRNSTDACIDRMETCACERSYQFVKCVVVTELNKHDVMKPAD